MGRKNPTPIRWILKFFLWLLMVDRLNTRNMLKRRHFNIGHDTSCVLCNSGHEETLQHLFFDRSFSSSCWRKIGFVWNTSLDSFNMFIHAKSAYQGPLFLELFTIAAWAIWKERNNLIFNAINPSFDGWKSGVISDLTLLRFRVAQNLVSTITSFISRL